MFEKIPEKHRSGIGKILLFSLSFVLDFKGEGEGEGGGREGCINLQHSSPGVSFNLYGIYAAN